MTAKEGNLQPVTAVKLMLFENTLSTVSIERQSATYVFVTTRSQVLVSYIQSTHTHTFCTFKSFFILSSHLCICLQSYRYLLLSAAKSVHFSVLPSYYKGLSQGYLDLFLILDISTNIISNKKKQFFKIFVIFHD